MTSATVGSLEAALFERFRPEWAEEWDRVGLLVGDPDRPVEGVFVALDATPASLARCRESGANVLVTHHPAALAMPECLLAGRGPGGTLFAALDAGIALIAEHTNLDRSPHGRRVLPELMGFEPLSPVERSLQPMTLVCTFVPRDATDAVVGAMSSAGAGRIGAYEACAFTVPGTGEFTAGQEARPAVGEIGHREYVDETRIEMVCARQDVGRVVAAAREAHPYEEPLVVTSDVSIRRGDAALGTLCSLKAPQKLARVAAHARENLGTRPRVWGDPSRLIRTVVTATGSASSLLSDVIASGADALLCGEVRYHDALDAASSGLSILECGHDATEWPLVKPLGEAVRSTPGIEPGRVVVSERSIAWWTP